MRRLDIVIADNDRTSAESLASSLLHSFRSVHIVHSSGELRAAILKYRAPLAVVDLETVELPEVETLTHDLGIRVVCTHRLADEAMWANVLGRGAIDCCHNNDVQSIVDAFKRDQQARSQAA